MREAFADLSTPLVADACLRCGIPLRTAQPGIRAVVAGQRIAGRVLPARHYGSVDVFLEAFGQAGSGDVLVVDNGGRSDEACVGDLAVLEAEAAGVAGLVVWGLHRDTPELVAIGLPVFMTRHIPSGGICAAPAEPSKSRACQTADCSFGSRHSAVSIRLPSRAERHFARVRSDSGCSP